MYNHHSFVWKLRLPVLVFRGTVTRLLLEQITQISVLVPFRSARPISFPFCHAILLFPLTLHKLLWIPSVEAVVEGCLEISTSGDGALRTVAASRCVSPIVAPNWRSPSHPNWCRWRGCHFPPAPRRSKLPPNLLLLLLLCHFATCNANLLSPIFNTFLPSLPRLWLWISRWRYRWRRCNGNGNGKP